MNTISAMLQTSTVLTPALESPSTSLAIAVLHVITWVATAIMGGVSYAHMGNISATEQAKTTALLVFITTLLSIFLTLGHASIGRVRTYLGALTTVVLFFLLFVTNLLESSLVAHTMASSDHTAFSYAVVTQLLLAGASGMVVTFFAYWANDMSAVSAA